MRECDICYAPLKPDETGICNRCKCDAGWYSDSAAYNENNDTVDLRKIKITCPFCGRKFAAMLSKFTKLKRHTCPDQDDECMAAEMETFCLKCRNTITFTLSW